MFSLIKLVRLVVLQGTLIFSDQAAGLTQKTFKLSIFEFWRLNEILVQFSRGQIVICKLSNHVFDDPPKGLRIGGSALSISKLLNAYRKSRSTKHKAFKFSRTKSSCSLCLTLQKQICIEGSNPVWGKLFFFNYTILD